MLSSSAARRALDFSLSSAHSAFFFFALKYSGSGTPSLFNSRKDCRTQPPSPKNHSSSFPSTEIFPSPPSPMRKEPFPLLYHDKLPYYRLGSPLSKGPFFKAETGSFFCLEAGLRLSERSSQKCGSPMKWKVTPSSAGEMENLSEVFLHDRY